MLRGHGYRLAGTIQHYRYDHLASVQVLTGFNGQVVVHLRSTAYGVIRHRPTPRSGRTWLAHVGALDGSKRRGR